MAARLLIGNTATPDSLYEIDPDGSNMQGSRLREFPSALTLPGGMVVYRGRLLVGNDSAVDSLYEIDPDGSDTQGTLLRSLPGGPRSLVVYRGRLLMANQNSNLYEVDPDGANSQGTLLRRLPGLDDIRAMAVYQNRLLGVSRSLAIIYEFDPDSASSQATVLRSIPTTANIEGATVFQNRLLVVSSNTLYEFDPDGVHSQGGVVRTLPGGVTARSITELLPPTIDVSLQRLFSGAASINTPSLMLSARPGPTPLNLGSAYSSTPPTLSSPRVDVAETIIPVSIAFNAGHAGIPSPTLAILNPVVGFSVTINSGAPSLSQPSVQLTTTPNPNNLSLGIFNAGSASLSSPEVTVEALAPVPLSVTLKSDTPELSSPTVITTSFSITTDIEVAPLNTTASLGSAVLVKTEMVTSVRQVINKSIGYLRGIVYESQARRHIAYLLRRAQRPASLTITIPYEIGKDFKLWDTIELNFTRVSGKFKISTYPVVDTIQGTVSFTALEDQDNIYTDQVVTAIGLREVTGSAFLVDAPENLSADSDAIIQTDGSTIVQTDVEWNEPPRNVVRILLQHRIQPSSV